MLHQMVRSAVHVILPNGPKERKIFRGLAKGIPANIDFEWDTAFYFGLHEPVLHQHYRRLLKPGMRYFDIGAYRGVGCSVDRETYRNPSYYIRSGPALD